MATNSVKVTLQIRHDTSSNWTIRNPVLAQGEYGLETDTYLLKIGDGVLDWEHLPYLNKLNAQYFKHNTDGTITFSDGFLETLGTIEAIAGEAIEHLTITEPPVNDTDATNKKYVDDAVAAAAGIKRAVVDQLPHASEADPNTLYMVLAPSGSYYEEYLVVNGVWDMVGETGDGGSGGFTLQIATEARLGGVKSTIADDGVAVDPNTGFMTINRVSTSKLYVPTGDTFIIYGGSA